METRIYTLHGKGEQPIAAIADRFDFFALALPPLWAIWHGLWLTLAAEAALTGLAALWSPLACVPVFCGIAVILAMEGASVARAELRLRGWRELGIAEARSPEGAEELYLRGQVLRGGALT